MIVHKPAHAIQRCEAIQVSHIQICKIADKYGGEKQRYALQPVLVCCLSTLIARKCRRRNRRLETIVPIAGSWIGLNELSIDIFDQVESNVVRTYIIPFVVVGSLAYGNSIAMWEV